MEEGGRRLGQRQAISEMRRTQLAIVGCEDGRRVRSQPMGDLGKLDKAKTQKLPLEPSKRIDSPTNILIFSPVKLMPNL